MGSVSAAEREVQAWLETVAAGDVDTGAQTLRSLPNATMSPTIVPAGRRDESVRRAQAFLAHLKERGRGIELEVGGVIGEGGMGVVREAEQVALGRPVAVKTLKPGRAEPGAASDLLREAWVTGALEHPNVVPVHHLEIDDALNPLLILKKVDGTEWSKLFNDPAEVQRRFGATDLVAWNLGILVQVLNAVRFAHARRIIHRDLKPSNVMIGAFGEVYLLDWGIAAALDEDPSGRFPHVGESSDLAGTPSYMAPEMLGREDSSGLSERTDIYLAGAVLFELIAGHPPHRGANAVAIISSVILSKPQLPADVPPELAQICLRCMQPDPADRYADVEQLQHALQRYLEHRGSLRLAGGAASQLAELCELAGGKSPAAREEVYRRLAICRFAFHEALAVWRDNREARDGLSRATIAVAEYELACGDPRAAVTLLSELHEKPPLLAQAEAAAARQQELAALGRDADPTIDPRTRTAVGLVTFAFVILPLVANLRSDMGLYNHERATAWAAISLGVAVVMYYWSRRKTMTAINRRVFSAAKLIFGAQLILAVGGWISNMPIADILNLNLFMWGALTGMFAIHTDKWLGITSVGYFAAFLFASRFPEYRQYAVAAANLNLCITVWCRWAPTAQRVAKQEP